MNLKRRIVKTFINFKNNYISAFIIFGFIDIIIYLIVKKHIIEDFMFNTIGQNATYFLYGIAVFFIIFDLYASIFFKSEEDLKREEILKYSYELLKNGDKE
jgi:hypothetical protein